MSESETPQATTAIPVAVENPVIPILIGDDPVVSWLLPNFIARGSLIIWAGEPGVGKSTCCYSLGLACATGIPFLNFVPVRPLRVLYFDQENSRPDRDQYLRWAWHGLKQPSIPLIGENFWTRHFELGTTDWHVKAAVAIRDVRPDLMIFDTATPCFAIENENDNGMATHAINRIRGLQSLVSPSPAAQVLKHSRIVREDAEQDKEPQRTIRGAKAWVGAADGVWFHVKDAGHPREDGLSNTTIQPAKTRAFGLRYPVHIKPYWTSDGKGLELTRRDQKRL